jgi:hypothetical protein
MKTMNLFASELQNYGLTTDDFRPASNPAIKKVSSVFGELCEVVELYHVSFQDGKYYPEYATVHVIYDGYIMRPYCRYNEKSFELFNLYEMADYSTDYRNKNERPQKIGKATPKKLQSWVDYLKNERAERAAYKKSIDEKVENFLGTVRNVQGMDIWDNETRGRMTKGGLEYTFSIDKKSGYIRQNIEVHYSAGKDIETFLKMSDNALK